MVKPFLFIGFILSVQLLLGQAYPIGLNPPSIHWKYIENNAAKVIFPVGINNQAQRIANIIQQLSDSSYYSLGGTKGQISVILQNQSITPNAFVGVGPFRSEFYTNPPQDNFGGAVDWNDLLTIHEYRHVQQLQNANRGIVKIGHALFGEYAWSVGAHLSLPPWFFEGDAVFTETALTSAGRGRMPYFEGEYRALLLSGNEINYEKNSAGSYKTFVPNIYNMGYHLTTALNRDYGQRIMGDLLSDALNYWTNGLFFSFSKSMKKRTNLSTPRFYKQTMAHLKSDWEHKAAKLKLTESEQLNLKIKRNFTDYKNPHFLNDSSLIVEKSGFDQIPTYYQLSLNGNEKQLFHPGLYSPFNASLSLDSSHILWAEKRFDARWGNVEYSNIMRYDLRTKLKNQLTTKARYFAPELSPTGLELIAVHSPADQYYALHLLDVADGRLKKIIKNTDNYQYAYPTWINEHRLATIVRKSGRNAIQIINRDTDQSTLLSPWWIEHIAHLNYHDKYLFFDGIFNGINNIYAISIDDGQVYQVTSTLLGAVSPDVSPNGQYLTYSQYSINGYDAHITEINVANWKKIGAINYSLIDNYQSTSKSDILTSIPTESYTVHDYKNTDGLKIHSRNLSYFTPDLGINVFVDNKMATLSGIARYNYNLNEKGSTWSFGIDFAQYYPVINLSAEQSNRSSYLPVYFETEENNIKSPNLKVITQNWLEKDIAMGIRLPFNLTVDNFYNKIWITQKVHKRWVQFEDPLTGTDGTFLNYDLDVLMQFVRRKAFQQINPRMGIVVASNYNKTIGQTPNASFSFLINSTIYLPGISRNHSFYTELAYHAEPFASSYKFLDNFRYARGYEKAPHDNIRSVGFNYSLPLCYPDLALGPIIFLKRIKTNLFYDLSISHLKQLSIKEITPLTDVSFQGNVPLSSEDYRSMGMELTFDFRFLRLVDLDLGVRFSHLLYADDSPNSFEFLLKSLSF
jgi:Tol biopolymer transport system component